MAQSAAKGIERKKNTKQRGTGPNTVDLSNISERTSASKLGFHGFLFLRVLWVHKDAEDFELDKYVDAASIRDASAFIQTPKCNEFLDSLTSTTKQYSKDSMYSLVSL